MIFLQIVLTTYLLGVMVLGAVVFSAVIRLGGWNGFVNQANHIAKMSGKKSEFTSLRVQWLCAFIIMCWPAVPIMFARSTRRS